MATIRFLVPVLVIGIASSAAAFPLDDAQQKCSANFIKSSVKVLTTLGKEVARCQSKLAKDGGGGGDDISACVVLDEKEKIAKAAAKVDGAIEKNCTTLPYAMTCSTPCEAVDDGGATTDIDDGAELGDCLACFNAAIGGVGTDVNPLVRGVYGSFLKDATVPDGGDVAKCQSSMIKGVGKLLQTKLKVATKCIDKELELGALGPPEICTTNLTTDSKVGQVIAKLSASAVKCSPPAPFDASICSGLDASGLADCLDTLVECRTCRWLNGVTGGVLDCDTFDNGAVDASCMTP
jgi:hypothetical protein